MKVTLIDHTSRPIETLYTIWEQSKGDRPLADIIAEASDPARIEELFKAVLEQEIPVAEAIVFNFVMEDVPISWREQAVRHRIGVSYGDRFGVDIIPEADLSFWSQSHRLKDMSRFVADGEFYTPPTIAGNPYAEARYRQALEDIEAGYADLIGLGIPAEDARSLLPLGATHRIAMTVNLRALMGIVGKRGCWVLQSSLWGPVISGIIRELAEKVHPAFRQLASPPCVTGGRFTECKFKVEMERRVDGRDDMPVCPLYATSSTRESPMGGECLVDDILTDDERVRVEQRIPEYAELWAQPNLAETWRWETPANA